ncbi:hypothetical protein, partial [Novosphingobium sp. ST904]|uniref:hypothetical protein n=1 Tax=Novosphingobium sp. ST904 TaxID=1684385 RepID=UPI001E62012A
MADILFHRIRSTWLALNPEPERGSSPWYSWRAELNGLERMLDCQQPHSFHCGICINTYRMRNPLRPLHEKSITTTVQAPALVRNLERPASPIDTQPVIDLVVADDFRKCFVRVEPVAGIILPGRRRRLSGQSLAHEAEIARSSR